MKWSELLKIELESDPTAPVRTFVVDRTMRTLDFHDYARTGHEKLFKRRFRLDVRQELSSIVGIGDRGHNRHGPKKGEGAAVPLSRRAETPSNTMWPEPRSTSVPSGVFMHPAVWPQYIGIRHELKMAGCASFRGSCDHIEHNVA